MHPARRKPPLLSMARRAPGGSRGSPVEPATLVWIRRGSDRHCISRSRHALRIPAPAFTPLVTISRSSRAGMAMRAPFSRRTAQPSTAPGRCAAGHTISISRRSLGCRPGGDCRRSASGSRLVTRRAMSRISTSHRLPRRQLPRRRCRSVPGTRRRGGVPRSVRAPSLAYAMRMRSADWWADSSTSRWSACSRATLKPADRCLRGCRSTHRRPRAPSRDPATERGPGWRSASQLLLSRFGVVDVLLDHGRRLLDEILELLILRGVERLRRGLHQLLMVGQLEVDVRLVPGLALRHGVETIHLGLRLRLALIVRRGLRRDVQLLGELLALLAERMMLADH